MMHLCSLTGQSQAARLYRYLQRRTTPATARDIHESICTMAPSTVVSNVRKMLDLTDSEFRLVQVKKSVNLAMRNKAGFTIGFEKKDVPAYKLERRSK